MGFLGSVFDALMGGGQAAPNAGAPVGAPAAPAAPTPNPNPGPVDTRRMQFSGPFVPGQPPPTATPDPYAIPMPGAMNHGPLTTPAADQPPPSNGMPPWGPSQLSDAAILAWYQNQHKADVGNMQTQPQMAAPGGAGAPPAAPPVSGTAATAPVDAAAAATAPTAPQMPVA